MNYISRYVVAVVLLALVLSPLEIFAQSSSGYRTYRRQSSEMQKKIAELDDDADESVSIPVLFGVTLRNISPNFGDPRSGGRSHEGEDIMAVKGTPIVSPTEAVVTRTGTGETEGKYVYTANPGGETFVYMHLDGIGEGVSSGDVLKEGDLIGYVGNTGNASGGAAHLHFEIRDDDNDATDPFPRLTEELTLAEKMKYLDAILDDSNDEDDLADLLVANFRGTFTSAIAAGVDLPDAITDSLGTVSLPTSSTPNAPVYTGTFTRSLELGAVGEDVRALQKFLNTHGSVIAASGAGSPGNETTYFGSLTQQAVISFQKSNNITPAVGFFGPITRGVVNGMK